MKLTRHGVESIEELKIKFKDEIEEKKRRASIFDPIKENNDNDNVDCDKPTFDDHKNVKKVIKDQIASAHSNSSSIKNLSTFVDVSKLSMHEPKEIEMIWRARFSEKKNTLCGAVNGITFSRIYKNSRLYPTFVLPLPAIHEGTEDEGWELHYVEWNLASPTTLHCIITSLAEYKLHQDYATPHTTLIFHSDLLADKQLVLMNGTVEKESNVGEHGATFLALQVQRFYGADESTSSGHDKIKLMKSFISGSEDFVLDNLLLEIQKAD